jgi:chromosome segregation ATPase
MATTRIAMLGLLGAMILAGSGCGGDTAKIEQLQAENARLEAERQKLAAAATEAEAKQKESGLSLATLNDQLAQATARLGDLSSQIDSAKLIATNAQAQYEEAAGKLAAAEAKVTELQNALEHTTEQAVAMSEQYRTEVEALRTQISELQTQLAAAVKALQDAQGLRQLLPK